VKRSCTTTLTKDEQQRLPTDFDAVLRVYDDNGDVQGIDFRDWGHDKAIRVFWNEGFKPRVRRVETFTPKRSERSAERIQALSIENGRSRHSPTPHW